MIDVSYHNRFAQSVFRDIAESLLSYERIHDVLGAWPRSLWSIAEDAERYAAWRQNPLVYVPK